MGLIHIYYGNGKGKTTAALGLALRACGAGMNIHIVQLMKGSGTSELESIKMLKSVTVDRPKKDRGFTNSMSEKDKAELTAEHDYLLSAAYEKMTNGEIDMLVIDEFFAAYNNDLVDKQLADMLVFGKSGFCELVLTGRDPQQKFIDIADYASEINSVKHPYELGIPARKGIEY